MWEKREIRVWNAAIKCRTNQKRPMGDEIDKQIYFPLGFWIHFELGRSLCECSLKEQIGDWNFSTVLLKPFWVFV